MDGPVYKLEQVVHSKAGMEDFEGPLDLILFLLSKNKIEIQDIPIALILEQYLAYLELRQQMDLEVASEFVTMASHLVYIKTRMLLSIHDEEAKSEMEQLVKALEERRSGENYAKIKFVTARLSEMGEFGRSILVKNPEPLERGKVYKYSQRPEELLAAWRQIVTSFRLLFRGNRSRSEMVATFLAVLEMCKARIIHLAGSPSDCTVTATGESLDSLQL